VGTFLARSVKTRPPSFGKLVGDDLRIFVLPDVQRFPPHRGELGVVAPVSLDVAVELPFPPLGVRLRNGHVLGTRVPIATVDEHRHAKTAEHEVRSARQVGAVSPIPHTASVKSAPQPPLRAGISPPLSRHEDPHLLGGRGWPRLRLIDHEDR